MVEYLWHVTVCYLALDVTMLSFMVTAVTYTMYNDCCVS
jgi:hypothetical protein